MKIENLAFNYDKLGQKYSGLRQTEPVITAYIDKELSNAKKIINLGATVCYYEPTERYVVAVEQSFVMRQQRLANNKIPAINARGYNLYFDVNHLMLRWQW